MTRINILIAIVSSKKSQKEWQQFEDEKVRLTKELRTPSETKGTDAGIYKFQDGVDGMLKEFMSVLCDIKANLLAEKEAGLVA